MLITADAFYAFVIHRFEGKMAPLFTPEVVER